jgi:hypothetical protein
VFVIAIHFHPSLTFECMVQISLSKQLSGKQVDYSGVIEIRVSEIASRFARFS